MKICINKQTNSKMLYVKYSYFIHVILTDYFIDDFLNQSEISLIEKFGIQVFTPESFNIYFKELE